MSLVFGPISGRSNSLSWYRFCWSVICHDIDFATIANIMLLVQDWSVNFWYRLVCPGCLLARFSFSMASQINHLFFY